MNTTEILLVLGLAATVLVTQLGRRTLTWRRMLLPLAVAALVGRQYLQSIPTAGGDLDFEIVCAVFGVACGVFAAGLVGLRRDANSGRISTEAGLAYAAVWVTILGGRLGFAYLATNQWHAQVRQFSMDHAITASAWASAFVLMALAMVVARILVVGGRAILLSDTRRAHASSLIAV
jgi:hypothetical protein